MEGISPVDIEKRLPIHFNDNVITTLRLLWKPTTDKFLTSVKLNKDNILTKSRILRTLFQYIILCDSWAYDFKV